MKKRGFTLVELLAVIAILAVILIVAVPKVNNYIMSSRKETFINNALNIARQLEYDNMDFITFDKAYIKDFELEKLNRNDIDINNSLVYVENNEIYIDLVGIGSYEGFYVCHVNSDSKNVTIQNTECGTSPDGLIYIDFEVNLDGGESTQKYNNQYASGNYLNLIPPKKYDLTFAGWEVVSGDSVISGNRIKFGTEATTIKSLWKQNSTLTVNLDGGTTTQRFQSKYSGGTTMLLKNPIREGYAFIGWEVVSGNSILSGNTLTIGSEDTVIKANWQSDKVNIRYNLDGGTAGASAPTEGKCGSIVTVSNPSKTGYTFAGWDVSGTGASINDTSLTIGTSDITLTANWTINTYTITYNLDGGTNAEGNPTRGDYGSTIILENPTKEGYTFLGLTASGNNAILSGNSLTIMDGDVTLTAEWVKTITEFVYTGGEQTFTAATDGYYKLEVWGAQGGQYSSYVPGYGGYSAGIMKLNQEQQIYITIGGKGTVSAGGYNGGGSTGYSAGGGGGATHIAIVKRGILSSYSSYRDEIIIVAGGGGGTGSFNGYSGGSGGGATGVNGTGGCPGTFGTQTSGGTTCTYSGSTSTGGGSGLFGIGGKGGTESQFNQGSGAGGGGWFGGSGGGARDGGGGGGSGYIGNSLLTDKYMYCYNCTTSDVESTKTYTTTCAQETPTENCAKIGNGYAKITFIGKTLSE